MPPAPRCESCAKDFSCQRDLKKHNRDIHRDQNPTPSKFSSYRCLEGCELSYTKCTELRSHLEDVHNQSHEVEELKFATNEEYISWLHSAQDNIPGKYVLTKGITRTKTAEKMYLHCPHSGKWECAQNIENAQASINQGQLKSQGSSLRNSACTSQITATRNITDGTYFVKYYKNHYRHAMKPQHLEISNIDRQNIVSMLMQSISPDPDSQTTSELLNTQSGQRSMSSELELSNKQHKEESKSYGKNVKCDICEKEFYYKKNLYAHMRQVHKIEMISKKEPKFQCDHCKVKFLRKFDLNKHLKKFHKTGTQDHNYTRTSMKKCRLVCSYTNCQEQFMTHVQLRAHLCDTHDIDIEFEEMTFDSKNEFEKWKTKMEQKTLSLYTTNSGIKKHVNTTQKQFYDCHRSYTYEKKGKTQRAAKSMGSNKINKACPSRLEVTFSKSQVSVIFWKPHCGHTAQIGRTCLDKDTKARIAAQLSQGVPFQRIIDNIRNDLTKEEGFQRVHMTQRQDLYNILRDFNITYATKRHHDDAVSIKLWVDEMKAKDECPILFYKGQNNKDDTGVLKDEDFNIIIMTKFQANQLKRFGQNKVCIDGTHGTNAYKFNLYSLVTVDEYGSGCPVAFCFSNREDESLFKLFFRCVKDCVGVIKPNVFMSDDAPAFYNAWASIMGEVPHRLLCTWHVDQNWRRNLCKISGGKAKNDLVYKTLRAVLRLTCADEFKTCLSRLCSDLLSDPDTIAFGQYFEKHYVQRSHLWAYCYRIRLGINTNMYLESLHKVLKHVYLEGKKIKRLDKTVDALMKISRDTMFERAIKIAKLQGSSKIRKIKKSHLQSATINVNIIVELSDSKWMVLSKTNIDRYVVQRDEEVSCTYCPLTCTDCKICIHTFTCSCLDNMIAFNICKHIHACARLCNNNLNENVESNSNNVENELNQLTAAVSYKGNNETALTDNILLEKKLELAIGLCKKKYFPF